MRISLTEAQSKKCALLIIFYDVIFCCQAAAFSDVVFWCRI